MSSSSKQPGIVVFYAVLFKAIRYTVGFIQRFFTELNKLVKILFTKSKNWGSSLSLSYEAKYGPSPNAKNIIIGIILIIIFGSNFIFPWLPIWVAIKAI
jgi:hypothetical protein